MRDDIEGAVESLLRRFFELGDSWQSDCTFQGGRLMPGPLNGFRIVDVTQMISGPMATMILADQGADVIKVEPPGMGDLTRALAGRRHSMSPTFAVANRNKRSVVIDLKHPRGVELLKRLVAGADVFVQNFRPGTVERMGIGEAALREVKHDLVYVS